MAGQLLPQVCGGGGAPDGGRRDGVEGRRVRAQADHHHHDAGAVRLQSRGILVVVQEEAAVKVAAGPEEEAGIGGAEKTGTTGQHRWRRLYLVVLIVIVTFDDSCLFKLGLLCPIYAANTVLFSDCLSSFSGCKFENVALLGGDLPPDLNGDGISLRSFVECRQACRLGRSDSPKSPVADSRV